MRGKRYIERDRETYMGERERGSKRKKTDERDREGIGYTGIWRELNIDGREK